jgi:hypothetical protein
MRRDTAPTNPEVIEEVSDRHYYNPDVRWHIRRGECLQETLSLPLAQVDRDNSIDAGLQGVVNVLKGI